ncbi:MAG TPA: 16S rRNA (adenine(1518)-N(6)/adenine(1519)-N(6))-dimethyltransferase RsmA [Chitinophagales bacterium]
MELKKSLGQHFLHDENMLRKIADLMGNFAEFASVLEVGPGHGALTKYLLQKNIPHFQAVDVDVRCVEFLRQNFPQLMVHHKDFLKADLFELLQAPACVVGNFPYNISSQIVFHILEYKELVLEMTGMFQKEMAVRIAASHNNKDYGVISVLTQAYYDCEYLLDIPPSCFNPPPKVMSGIIRIKRKKEALGCDEKLFRRVVKQVFTQRRKMLSNSLKPILQNMKLSDEKYSSLRPEQLSVADFVQLTNLISEAQIKNV